MMVAVCGCGDAPTKPLPGNPQAFDAKAKAMQAAAADPKFDDFRAACADYKATLKKSAELGAKMHAGTASLDDTKTWSELDSLLEGERKELLAFIHGDGFTAKDRTTMHWIMNAPTSRTPEQQQQ